MSMLVGLRCSAMRLCVVTNAGRQGTRETRRHGDSGRNPIGRELCDGVVQAAIDRIKALDGRLNAVVHRRYEAALAAARQLAAGLRWPAWRR